MRGKRLTSLGSALAVSLLAACGSSGQGPETDPDTDTDPPSIEYALSGGIAGVQQRVTVGPEDEVSVAVDRERSRPVDIDPELVEAARAELETVDFSDVGETMPLEPIPDAFNFTLAYGGERVSGSMPGLPEDSPLRASVAAMSAVLQAAIDAAGLGPPEGARTQPVR